MLNYTSEGNLKFELYTQKAPITLSIFLAYIDSNIYDGALFYKTVRPDNQPNNNIKIGVIQGGLSFNDSDEEFSAIYHESTFQTGILRISSTLRWS